MTSRAVPDTSRRPASSLEPVGRRPRRPAHRPGWFGSGCAGAVLVVGAATLAWATPRGPVTAAQAYATIVAALALGVLAGAFAPTRWSLPAAPVVFTAVFELSRIDVAGPTVDAPRLDSVLGIAAFVLGRVWPALVTLLPLALGVGLGIALAHRMRRRGVVPLRPAGWVLTGGGAAILVTVAAMIAPAAVTAAIPGADGRPLPGSVAELVSIPVGGHDQTLMIRGRSAVNPVLLYLAGGPGGTDLGAMRRDTALEQDFVVAVWDQRGAGRSYPALDPTRTLTVEQMISDTVEVTEYLRARFGADRIVLVGQSWGSLLGALVAQRRPDLYSAFVGVGQIVCVRETDEMAWQDALAWADKSDPAGLAAQLRENGPPPYADVNDYEPILTSEHDWNAYPGFDPATEMPAILLVPEYSVIDRINAFRGFLDTAAVLYPQLQGIDLRFAVPVLKVPYHMVIGEYETRGRATLARDWFTALSAPDKHRHDIVGAGHRPNFDRPAEFAAIMRDVMAQVATR